MRILLVEDDAVLGDGLSEGLKLRGHAVDWLRTGGDAGEALANDEFDGVVLDLDLPEVQGMELLRRWRAGGETVPVLVLTAFDETYDCVEALDFGADDYVTKPAPLSEIEARLRAIGRRREGLADNRMTRGDLAMQRGQPDVSFKGRRVVLSAYELSVLEALMERPGAIVTREALTDRLYGWDDGPESNSLEVLIHKLRSKIGRDAIGTVRGLGYRLT